MNPRKKSARPLYIAFRHSSRQRFLIKVRRAHDPRVGKSDSRVFFFFFPVVVTRPFLIPIYIALCIMMIYVDPYYIFHLSRIYRHAGVARRRYSATVNMIYYLRGIFHRAVNGLKI